MMEADDVLGLLDRLTAAGIAVWLDGGWGVDALTGAQSRPHGDLDLVLNSALLPALVETLAPCGYAIVEDESPTRVVLADGAGHGIDIHLVTFDAGGGGLQTLQDGRVFRYPPEGFGGTGRINGQTVRCLTPEVQLLCHLGYEPDDTDQQDMRLLATHFGLKLPHPYTV